MKRLLPALLFAFIAAAAQAQHRVDFTLDMSAEIAAGRLDPARDQVGLRGAAAPLDWGRTLPAHAIDHGRYAVSVNFAEDATHGQPLQYKIKIDRPGVGGDEGWESGGNRTLMLTGKTQQVQRAFNSEVEASPLSRVGMIERLAPLPSRFVSARAVQVWLPPGYAELSGRRYPVLYLHDGQNVFDAAAAGAEWQVDEAAQAGIRSRRLAPFIVVAVDNTAERMGDYTPSAIWLSAERLGKPQGAKVGGGAANYARYLIEELKPFIDSHYATQADAAHTAVGGSSLGGLMSLWLALHHSDIFGAALVVSPSVWWDDQLALREVAASRWPGAVRPRLWLDMGGREGPGALEGARKLRDGLLSKGWSAKTLRYVEAPEAAHTEASWAQRVPGMLEFLYGR